MLVSARARPLRGWKAVLVGFLAWPVVPAGATAEPAPSLLVLHAYHQGFEWSDRLHQGLLTALEGLPLQVHVEHLDTKRIPDKRHLPAVASLLASKHADQGFDVIVAFDDNALDFALEYRERLWSRPAPASTGGETGAETALGAGAGSTFRPPIVFGGLNDYNPDLAGIPGLTGVVETVDFAGTLSLARRLIPELETVLVLGDATRTSSTLAEHLRSLARSLSSGGSGVTRARVELGAGLRFAFLTAKSLEEAGAWLEAAPPRSIALLLPFSQGLGGRFVDYRRAAEHLTARAPIPILSCWNFYLGHGIVGGRITSAALMGQETGRRVRRILEGEDASALPILEQSPTRLQLDYRALERHAIPMSRVPAEAELLGAPARTLHVDKRLILPASAAVTGMIFAVLFLGSNVVRRRRAERELLAQQEVLQRALANESMLAEIATLLNTTDNFKTVIDGILAQLIERLDVARISLYSFFDEQAIASSASSRLSARARNSQEIEVRSFWRARGVFDALRTNERVVSGDLEALHPEDQEFYREQNIRAIVILPVQVAGRVRGALGFAQDVERAWSDDEVAVFQTIGGMIAAAWERYEEMQARLEAEAKHADAIEALEKSARMAAVGVIAAGITHEINQPLNAIRITTEGALRRALQAEEKWPEATVKRLRTVSAAVNRIDQIIRHMRELWVGRERRTLELVDLREVVSRAFELVGRQARNRGIALRFHASPEPVLVLANPLQLEQVVINLVVNAVQTISERQCGTEIRVLTRADGHRGVLEVSDDGPGVAEADVPRLFDPFFSTKSAGRGTGLGLAIVRSIVESFEGNVEHERPPAGGATFRVTLPRSSAGRSARV